MPEPSRERYFAFALFLMPILLLILLEAVLRVAGFAEDRRRSLKPIENQSGWVGINPEYPGRYFRGFLPAVAFTPFRTDKPSNGIRVVVLGGSSTAGFPYQWYHGFPAGLERRLSDQFPGRAVEVVNLGMTAVNSYTLWDLTRHVVDMEPDLVVIYAGHNEFYGALGAGATADWMPKGAWFGRLLLTLKRSALVVALERVLLGPPDYGLEPGSNERTLMARVVKDSGIEYAGNVYQAGLNQFESNMGRVLDKLKAADIPVLAGTLVSNLADQHPLSQTEDAVVAYQSGKAALAAGELESARDSFERARDLDQIRFRGSGELNAVIRSWGDRTGVSVVDLEPVFEEAAETGIPGNDLFTDHLHPTHEGYEIMAEAFAIEAIRLLESAGLPGTPLALDWAHADLLDGLSEAEAGILIDRLLSDYPFNLEADPESATSKYASLLRERQASGRIADSLAIAIMTTDLSTQNALLDGAGLQLAAGDSSQALKYYHSLLYWQPFNTPLMEEIVGRFLSSSSWDEQLEKLALLGATRSDQAYFWNALAVTQIRQEKWDAAAVALQEAERVDASSPVMLYNRARLEFARGDTAAARSTLEAYRRAAATGSQ
jgi:lysophospholipase L1-like esterase